MSKPWKPGKETVPLRPSRIRRDPVRLDKLDEVEAKPRSREREIWGAVAGVGVIAAGCAALIVGVSQVTNSPDPVEAASAVPRFGHCRTVGELDCIVDGDTFLIAGARVEIAGIDAPEIHRSNCPEEARRGIQAAVRLHDLLNRGPVTLTAAGAARDAARSLSRKVEVDGIDVGAAMVAGGFARDASSGPRSWC